MSARLTKVAFVATAAVTAASLGDALMEHVANAGAFGRGTFTDGSNADLAPAGALAAIMAFVLIALVVRRTLSANGIWQWLRSSASHLDARTLGLCIPAAYVAQLGTLYTMETLEQRFVVGHVFGGTVWLGGPIAASLAIHAIVCVAVSLLLARASHAIAQRIAGALGHALRVLAERSTTKPAALGCRRAVALARARRPFLRRIGGRAPPAATA